MKKSKYYLTLPLALILSAALFAIIFIAFLTIFEYRPGPVEDVPFTTGSEKLLKNKQYSILTWNMGYAGLGKNEDFFMDGGKKVRPDSKKVVEEYLAGIAETLKENPSDIIFMQEIDLNSKRTWNMNQYEALKKSTSKAASFACNFKCLYVPYPLPTIGRVESGLSIFTNFETTSAQRRSLPVLFKWPVRIANLKRCMLVTRIPVYENEIASGKELVLVDFHLEAFDKGEGKIAQTKALKDFIDSEYAKGNYVIAGGDFNQRFPGSNAYPHIWKKCWAPGKLDEDFIKKDWNLAFDDTKPTCRSNTRPYNDEDAAAHNWQYHVIDGFIISPNIEKLSVKVIDKDFQNSDHNPVFMTFRLN